jgi:endogenous inhibitor of DNA gyrase (YacG/DUF329 family)
MEGYDSDSLQALIQREAPMTAPAPLPPDQRQQLRQEWLAAAATAFDRMFDEAEQHQLVTFSQREDRAALLGLDLGAWLLERHVAADPQTRPRADPPPKCPKCGRPSKRVTKANGPLPRRQLTTLTGEVELRREQWRCTACRVVFFPPGPQAAPGNGGL